MANLESCAANATVVGVFQAKFATAGYQRGAREYAGPNILLGTTWPLVTIAFAIAAWKLAHSRQIRSVLLLVGVLVNIGDCVNVSWGRTIDPLKLKSPGTYELHFDLAIIMGQLKICLIVIAGAIRFSKAFIESSRRNLTCWGLIAFTVAWTTMSIAIGCSDVAKGGRASGLYWGLVAGQPVSYILVGLIAFTRTLQQAEDSLSSVLSKEVSSPNSLSHLRISNNILMGITLACAVCLTTLTQVEDTIANRWVLPGVLLLGTIWILAECCFELLAQLHKFETAIASQKSQKSEMMLTQKKSQPKTTLKDEDA
ncbi:hypothetical protein DFJ77DRAFT_477652 [Powellomyces hirtus]|nr:hypothetical protein DFJ77DRAFT_477652 [Powellomyces hirtus]